jgi:hypothetical protein
MVQIQNYKAVQNFQLQHNMALRFKYCCGYGSISSLFGGGGHICHGTLLPYYSGTQTFIDQTKLKWTNTGKSMVKEGE